MDVNKLEWVRDGFMKGIEWAFYGHEKDRKGW